MSSNVIARRVADAAKSINIKGLRDNLASKVKDITTEVLNDWGAVTVGDSREGRFGLENFGQVVPTRVGSFSPETADLSKFMKRLKEVNLSDRHVMQVATESLTLFDGDYNPSKILRDPAPESSFGSLYEVVGRTEAANIENFEANYSGIEAFGDDINRLASDDRLTMSLMIMRPHDNIMDKAFARVSESSPIVKIRIPEVEVYNWAKTQDPNGTVDTRFGSTNSYRLRDLYRDPSQVNSSTARVVPVAANDIKGVLWNSTTMYKTGAEFNLFDLARNAAQFGTSTIDRSDLLSEGGFLTKLIVSLKSGSTTEYFGFDTRTFDLAYFVNQTSVRNSGSRIVNGEFSFVLSSTSKQYDGTTASTIMGAITDAKIKVKMRFTANLNLQTANLTGQGTVNLELLQLAAGTAIGSTTQTTFGSLVANIVAFDVDVRYDEENQRKANLAVWAQYYEKEFPIPRGRIYFTDYSLTQDVDNNAISGTSSVMALGNGRRGLDILVNALNDTASANAFAAANPELVSFNQASEQSFASSLVKPTVITTNLAFDVEDINTMNESTRLTEMHGRFRARFLSMVTLLFAKSLMLNQYKGGEKPVLKVFTHSTIADVIIGILEYHPDLKDETTTATGADYSMLLPNGYRIDIVKTNWDCLQQRLYAVPVIESKMDDILSAASIRDCGMVTTNYTPTYNASVVRRVATTSREILFVTNKVGVMMNITGLQTQLGASSNTPVLLNQNYTDSLTV